MLIKLLVPNHYTATAGQSTPAHTCLIFSDTVTYAVRRTATQSASDVQPRSPRQTYSHAVRVGRTATQSASDVKPRSPRQTYSLLK
mgnify:CR=1 FL=1